MYGAQRDPAVGGLERPRAFRVTFEPGRGCVAKLTPEPTLALALAASDDARRRVRHPRGNRPRARAVPRPAHRLSRARRSASTSRDARGRGRPGTCGASMRSSKRSIASRYRAPSPRRTSPSSSPRGAPARGEPSRPSTSEARRPTPKRARVRRMIPRMIPRRGTGSLVVRWFPLTTWIWSFCGTWRRPRRSRRRRRRWRRRRRRAFGRAPAPARFLAAFDNELGRAGSGGSGGRGCVTVSNVRYAGACARVASPSVRVAARLETLADAPPRGDFFRERIDPRPRGDGSNDRRQGAADRLARDAGRVRSERGAFGAGEGRGVGGRRRGEPPRVRRFGGAGPLRAANRWRPARATGKPPTPTPPGSTATPRPSPLLPRRAPVRAPLRVASCLSSRTSATRGPDAARVCIGDTVRWGIARRTPGRRSWRGSPPRAVHPFLEDAVVGRT